MSFEEKSTWGYLVVAVGVATWYFATVLPRLASTPVAEVSWAPAIITAFVASIVGSIVYAIVFACSTPKQAQAKDVRDRDISKHGEYVGGVVLGALAGFVLLLLVLDIHKFWAANALYLSFIIQAVVSSIVKLVAYRRGF